MFQRIARTLCLLSLMAAGLAPGVGAQTFGGQQQISAPPEAGATGAFGLVSDIDGTTIVIGSPDETVGGAVLAGAAYVMVKNGSGAWVLQQRITLGTADRHFGSAVAVSGDTMAIGSKPTSVFNTATVRIYTRSGTSWTLQQEVGAHRATALRLKADTLVVGDIERTNQGEVIVYERTGTVWGAGTTLTAAGGTVNNGQFGAAVDFSGSTLCVGVPKDTANGVLTAGSVRVLTRSGPGAWSEQQKIDGPTTNSFFGSGCSVDGDTLLIGALNITNGRAFVFVRSGATWSQQQQLTIDQVSGNVAGQFVRLVGDLAVVGGFRNLTVLGRTGSTWTTTQTLPAPSDGFAAIGLTASTLAAGTNPAGAQHGSVFVYSLQATGPPGPPTNFQGTVDGSTVNLSWGAPTTGAAPTRYTIVARNAAGATIATLPVDLNTSYSTPAPNGTYSATVFASNAFGNGPETVQRTLVVPSLPSPPGVPQNLVAAVSGNTVSFTWGAASSGGAASGYTLLGGTSPGFTTPSVSLPQPGSSLGATVTGVPSGTYYARVVAQNAAGFSGASNEVTVTVGSVPPPSSGAPTLNAAQVTGSTVTLSWTPASGTTPAAYGVTARLPNGAVAGPIPVLATTATYTNVPSGTYAVSVVAITAAGVSAPSNQITFVVQ